MSKSEGKRIFLEIHNQIIKTLSKKFKRKKKVNTILVLNNILDSFFPPH